MKTGEPVHRGDDLAARLARLPSWSADGDWITRTITTGGWRTTMMVVNAIAFVAEVANHHPDLGVHWGKVVIRLQTHSAGGVTDKDLQLAEAIDQAIGWRPAGGFPGLEGPAGDWKVD